MKTPTPSRGRIADVLDQVRQQLDHGQVDSALRTLIACGQDSQAVRNAKGVCMLRLGRLDPAAKIFRDLVCPDKAGEFHIPLDTPAAFRVNYATALLLKDNLLSGVQLLREIPDHRHPAVQRLRAALRGWRRSLPWWRRILLPFGIHPKGSLRLDFAPGDLWNPDGPEDA